MHSCRMPACAPQVVSTALPECKNPEQVSVAVKAFMQADLQVRGSECRGRGRWAALGCAGLRWAALAGSAATVPYVFRWKHPKLWEGGG